MILDKQKYEMLEKAGFASHHCRSLYVNRVAMKIISFVSVEDHNIKWLQSAIEPTHKLKIYSIL